MGDKTTYYSDIHTITTKTPIHSIAGKAERIELDTDGDGGERVMGKDTTIRQQEEISWDRRAYQNNTTQARAVLEEREKRIIKIREFYDQYSYP